MSLGRSDFRTIKALAAGAAGGMNAGIMLVLVRRTGKKAIEKRFDENAVRRGVALREVKTMLRCNHRNICTALGHDLDSRRTGYGSLFMEVCELGSIDQLISSLQRRRETCPEGFLWKVLWDMSLALCFLQTGVDAGRQAREGRPLTLAQARRDWSEIVHCDIKPANIFITMREATGQYPTVVLGDFGCAISDGRRHDSCPEMDAWTMSFAPPEAPAYSDVSDVYSTALSVHCLAALRQSPSRDKESVRHDPLGQSREYTGELKDLVRRMLRHDLRRRPDALYLPYLIWREKSDALRRLGKSSRTAWRDHPAGLFE